MSSPSPRIQALLSGAAPALQALAAEPTLDTVLAELFTAGKAAWPTVSVDEPTFLAHLGARFPETEQALGLLRQLHAGDLYLACACSRGDAVALAALETHFLLELAPAIARVRSAPAFVDEVQQRVRRQLMVADNGPPKISDYSGYGALMNWVRATAVRAATRHIRQEARELPLEHEALAALAQPNADPELAYIQELYREDFKTAFEAALGALSSRDRNVLRLHVLDGLNIAEVGSLYRTHRSTIARWIASARELLLEETRRNLREKHGFHTTELESLMNLLHSQLDVSLARLLRPEGE